MVRMYTTYYNSKKRARPKKKDDIFKDKWAPTEDEMKLAERCVYNSNTQSKVLQGNKPQHLESINNENVANGAKKKVIYATPLPNPRIKKKKKAVLYAKPIHPLPPPAEPPKEVTKEKKFATPVFPLQSSTSELPAEPEVEEVAKKEKKFAAPILPLQTSTSTSPASPPEEEETAKKEKKTRTHRLWSTLDQYFKEEPKSEEQIFSLDDANSITSSVNSIRAGTPDRKSPRKSLFSRVFGSTQQPQQPLTCLASTPPRKNLVETSNSTDETVTSGPVSLDEFIPVTQIRVNNEVDEPRQSLGGRFRTSLMQSSVANRVQKKRDEWLNKNPELPPPEQDRQRQKPHAKPLLEISTDDNALNQRQHRMQVDATHRANTIMMSKDNEPLKPSPVKRDKSGGGGEEANEVVEVMDLTTMSLEDFQLSFQENSNACLVDVYEIEYPVHKSLVSGTLSIALPQDVFLLVDTQLSLLDEYIARNKLNKTRQGDRLLVDSILSILKNISTKQAEYRDTFLQDSFEGCIAAANSFMYMVDKVEEFMELVKSKYTHLSWCDTDPVTWMPCQEAKELCAQFSQDAVLAGSAEAVCFIMDEVHDAGLSSLLFSPQWEEELVHNEVSVSMTRILERKISLTSKWLEHDYLFHKFVGALVRATICFYMEGIVHKAERLRSARRTLGKKAARKKVAFRNPRKACGRLSDDIAVLQDYFEDIAEKSIALARVISKEFSFLSLLVECMLQAGKSESADVEIAEFVYAMHKETGANFEVTKYFMSDVWLLMGPKGEHHRVEQSIDGMHAELRVFTVEDLETAAMANVDMNGFKLHEVMFSLYHERIKRERTYMAIAEGAIKKTRRDIKKELKNTELRVHYFLEDLHEEFAALNGSIPRQGEF